MTDLPNAIAILRATLNALEQAILREDCLMRSESRHGFSIVDGSHARWLVERRDGVREHIARIERGMMVGAR